MAENLTLAQKTAIDMRDKTLLISAAAGSGKTYTLTQRIIKRITDKDSPADISKMLIVTFTRAAAAELHAKIFAALSDAIAKEPTNKHLTSQLMKMGSAKISTIDSFYFDLVKSNLSALGLSGVPRIVDDAEYIILAHDIMEETIEQFYEDRGDFPAFVECFASVKQVNSLSDTFLDIHKKLLSLPSGIEFLRKCAEQTSAEKDLDFFATLYGKILQKNSNDVFEHCMTVLSEALDFARENDAVYKAYGEAFSKDHELCKALCDAVKDNENGYSRVRALLIDYKPQGLSALRGSNATEESMTYRDARKKCTQELLSLQSKAFSKTPETIKKAMCDTAKYTHILYELLHAFEEKIGEEKSRLGVLTFSDVRRLTLELLVGPDQKPTEFSRQYAEQFDEIYIDEYQDVDQVQDLIFSSIARPDNRFMVGDIKQSIYEFRGADPSLFAKYRKTFPLYDTKEAEDSNCLSIFMSNNFRCDKNIIDFTNRVCSKIFSVVPESIGYTKEDDLVFSKQSKNPEYISSKVKVAIVEPPKKEDIEEDENLAELSEYDCEAEYIASEICSLLANGKKENGDPIVPEDIAILYRSKNIVPHITAALKRHGVFCSEDNSTKYFESPDVLLVLCILNAIDNPERDTSMAGALRSPIFNFTIDDLLKLRITYDESFSLFAALCAYAEEHNDELATKCKTVKDALEVWQDSAASVSIDRFLLILFDSEQFISAGIVAHPNDDGEGGNLLMLYEYARSFENGSFKGLYQFIEYINSIIERGKTLQMGESESTANKVSLMTMHKSKGLERPVCFVCGTADSIKAKDVKESLVFDKSSGVAMKVSESTGMARINTPMREAIISKIITKQAEEEMRILYVALTRAREKLYVTASSRSSKLFEHTKNNIAFFDRHTVINQCSSYIEWILLSCPDEENPTYELDVVDIKQLLGGTQITQIPEEKTTEGSCGDDPALTKKLKEKFAFRYPYSALSSVPSKLSVSRLYPDVLDENQDGLELFTEPKKAVVPDFFTGNAPSAPSATEKGTATHLFLQFCDFKYAYTHGADAELARLEEKKFLAPNASSLIYTKELESFLQSELIHSILNADKVIREQRFNIKLSAKGFTKNEELLNMMQDEELAVQGVIDLVLIDWAGNIELYDYKTDRLTKAELDNVKLAKARINRDHARQLSYYAKAAELLFGRPCKRVAVYSTHSALIYDIDVLDLMENLF